MSAIAANFPTESLPHKRTRLRQTRVLIVSDHPVQSRDVATNLRHLDLDVQLSLFDGKTLNAIPTTAPDAILCHLTDFPQRGPQLAQVVRAHFDSRPIPIIGALSKPFPDASTEFNSTLYAPMHPSQIANRVKAMIRLGAMENEISRRFATLREDFKQNPQIGDMSPNRRFRILFIGKASPAFMVIINALQDKNVDVVAAFTSFSAFDYLHGDPFDAVVMNALEQSEPALSISEAMRRNSKLYHIPTLFLIDEESFNDHDAAYERGARDIITMKADSEEISGRILELANYHRVHEQLKADIFALTSEHARDKSGAVFSREFIEAHLPRVMADAHKSDRLVTLVGLSLSPNSTDPVKPEALESAYEQTANLIQNLVRMQDIVSRWDDNNFVLSFYDTDPSAAEIILSRIEALIDCSAFSSGPSQEAALTLSVKSYIHTVEPSDQSAKFHLNSLMMSLQGTSA